MATIRLHNDDLGYETNCFVCEQRNARGLQIPFFHDTDEDIVVAHLELSNDFSGAPTMLHGGVVLAVLDEAMAWACIAIGRRWAVTSEMTTRFDRAIYVDKPYRVEAAVTEQSEAELAATARVVDANGKLRAEANARFTILGEAQMKRAIGTDDDLDPSVDLG